MGVRVINPDMGIQTVQLIATVNNLCGATPTSPTCPKWGFPVLRAQRLRDGAHQRRSLVAVSTGLLRRMSQKELEGVSHEISTFQMEIWSP